MSDALSANLHTYHSHIHIKLCCKDKFWGLETQKDIFTDSISQSLIQNSPSLCSSLKQSRYVFAYLFLGKLPTICKQGIYPLWEGQWFYMYYTGISKFSNVLYVWGLELSLSKQNKVLSKLYVYWFC